MKKTKLGKDLAPGYRVILEDRSCQEKSVTLTKVSCGLITWTRLVQWGRGRDGEWSSVPLNAEIEIAT